MNNNNVSGRGLVIGMLISMFIWGLSWPSGKVLTQFCTPINFAGYRYIIVVITLLPILFLLKAGLVISKEGIPSVIITGILLALYSFLFFKGLSLGKAGAGGVLVTTLNPIMAYIVGIFLSRHLPSKNEILGLVLGIFASCFLLKVWDNANNIFASGNLYFLSAAFTWAAMSKITSKGGKYGSSLSFTFWQYFITLICILPLMNFHELNNAIQIKQSLFWYNMFFSSAIVTTLATTVFFYSTTRLGAEKASSFLFLVPLAAALSSWVFLDETIQFHTIVGGFLGMGAVYFINKKVVLIKKNVLDRSN